MVVDRSGVLLCGIPDKACTLHVIPAHAHVIPAHAGIS